MLEALATLVAMKVSMLKVVSLASLRELPKLRAS